MVNLFGNHEVQYTFVNGGSRLRPTYSLRTIITTASILLATVISSFYAGRSSISQATKGPLDRTPLPLFSCTSIPRSCASYFFACGSPPDLLAKVPTHSQIFYQNHTFGAAPSNVSNAAWASLFPDQGGFFKHPNIAPQRSAWAVFHQLHCLNGLREGYWALHDSAVHGNKLDEQDIPMMGSPHHVGHCIDLIRQSLMCQPDMTIEVKDEKLGGVTGFGTRHVCRAWDRLVAWTSAWETYDHSSIGQERRAEMEAGPDH